MFSPAPTKLSVIETLLCVLPSTLTALAAELGPLRNLEPVRHPVALWRRSTRPVARSPMS